MREYKQRVGIGPGVSCGVTLLGPTVRLRVGEPGCHSACRLAPKPLHISWATPRRRRPQASNQASKQASRSVTHHHAHMVIANHVEETAQRPTGPSLDSKQLLGGSLRLLQPWSGRPSRLKPMTVMDGEVRSRTTMQQAKLLSLTRRRPRSRCATQSSPTQGSLVHHV